MDERVATTRGALGAGSDTRRFVYAPDGRVLGEYGASASDVKAEFIWMSPEGNESGAFGGDDGLGGYMPLAVAVPTATAGITELNWVHSDHLGVPIWITDASGMTIAQSSSYTAPAFPGQSRTLADLYYNKYRDYDPTTGRYIQADPIGLAGGASPYSYAMNNPLRYSDPTGLIVDTIADVVFVGYDIYNIFNENIFGDNCPGSLGTNLTALAADVGGVFVPFATGGGVAVRAASHADDIAKVTANRLRGNAARDELADLLASAGRTVTKDKYFSTPFGKRYVDIDVWLNGTRMGGVEVKSGRSRYLPSQRAKDMWIWLAYDGYKVQVVRIP